MLALMLVLALVLVLVVWQGGRVPTKPIYFPLSRPARWRWWGAGQLKAIFNGLAERNSLQVQTLCGFLHEKNQLRNSAVVSSPCCLVGRSFANQLEASMTAGLLEYLKELRIPALCYKHFCLSRRDPHTTTPKSNLFNTTIMVKIGLRKKTAKWSDLVQEKYGGNQRERLGVDQV